MASIVEIRYIVSPMTCIKTEFRKTTTVQRKNDNKHRERNIDRYTDRQRDREREKSYANDHAKEGEKNVPTTVLMDPTEPRNHTIPLELCS